MACTDDFLVYDDYGTVSQVVNSTTCVQISSKVKSFQDGKETSYVFVSSAATLQTIDFSTATNLEKIGSYTFYKCTKVQTFDLSKCTSLKSIGMCAFTNCTGATSIIFPSESQLTCLPSGIFTYCSSLESFTIPYQITVIESDNPANYGVFAFCTSLKNVIFANGSRCESIGGKAFFHSSLQNIKLPSKLKSIDGFSFRICHSLKSIDVDEENSNFKSENGVLLKNDGTLVYFPQKSSYVINSDLTVPREIIINFGSYCFAGVTLNVLTVPERYTNIPAYTFAYSEIKYVIFPSTINSMGNSLFQSAYYLKNVTYHNSPASITNECFWQCQALEEFYIPQSVVTIGDKSFRECSNLKKVYVPKSVTTFGTGVFISCHKDLELIFDKDTTLTFQNSSVFQDNLKVLKFYLGEGPTAYIPSGVEIIDSAAFQNKPITGVEYANINLIESIGEAAFAGSSIIELTLPAKLTSISPYTFSEATSLKNITIPKSVTSIGEYAFNKCTGLTDIIFDEESSLDTIGAYAFKMCTKVQSFDLPYKVKQINESAFSSFPLTTFNLPDLITYIGPLAFANSNIESLSFGQIDQLVTLKSRCFANMKELTSLTIPNSVQFIEADVANNCPNLKEVVIGEKVTNIADQAFHNLASLETVYLNNSNVDNLTAYTFYECPKLKYFEVNESNFIFDNGILFNSQLTELILYLKIYNLVNITIPPDVTTISHYAFSDCSSIRSVCFEGESKIRDIKLGAFQNCKSLKQVNFPSSLTTIAQTAFQNCDLEIIYLLYTNVQTIAGNTFSGNKRVKQIILPTVLSEIDETALSDTNPNVYVFYHGNHTIEHSAGLHRTAKVFCYDRYKSDIFLALPVQKEFKCPTSSRCPLHQIQSVFYIFLISSTK